MAASTPMAHIATPRLAFPALILANIILALGPVLVRLADVGPVAAAFWRLAIAMPFLFILALPKLRKSRLSRGQWTIVILAGVCFAADLAAWHLGIGHTKVANATLFGNMSALMLPLWGLIVLREHVSKLQIGALILAAIGSAILMGSSYVLSPANLKGDLFCLLAGLLYTTYLLLIQGARKRLDSWSVLAVVSAAGALPLLLAANAMGEAVMPQDWTPLIILALSSQIVGQGLLTYALGCFSPLVLGLSLLLQPAVAALAGWLLFGETLSATDIVGGVAVAVALVLVRLPRRA